MSDGDTDVNVKRDAEEAGAGWEGCVCMSAVMRTRPCDVTMSLCDVCV